MRWLTSVASSGAGAATAGSGRDCSGIGSVSMKPAGGVATTRKVCAAESNM